MGSCNLIPLYSDGLAQVKITDIETIPVDLSVGKFRDGDHKVRGVDAPRRYPVARDIAGPRAGDENLILSNVIVKIHTDDGITGIGEAACDTTEPGLGIELDDDKIEAFRSPGFDR
jgi:hypothetical protein